MGRSSEQSQKGWLIWIGVLILVGSHLIAVVLITHHHHNLTSRYEYLLKAHQDLKQQISHHEIERAYQLRLSRIEAWAKENGMQTQPSQEHKIIVPAE